MFFYRSKTVRWESPTKRYWKVTNKKSWLNPFKVISRSFLDSWRWTKFSKSQEENYNQILNPFYGNCERETPGFSKLGLIFHSIFVTNNLRRGASFELCLFWRYFRKTGISEKNPVFLRNLKSENFTKNYNIGDILRDVLGFRCCYTKVSSESKSYWLLKQFWTVVFFRRKFVPNSTMGTVGTFTY